MNSDLTIAAPGLLAERRHARRRWLGWDVRALLGWSVKSGLAVFDQAAFSGANLLLNVLLARWLKGAEYGGFAVAFTAFLLLSGFHSAIVLEPMSVLGPANYSDQPHRYFRAQVKIHFALCGILTALAVAVAATVYFLGADHSLWSAILGCGIALPFLLLLWLTRRQCYCRQRPSQALLSSVLYSACLLGGAALLFQLGRLSSFTAFMAMALASVVAAAVSLMQAGWMRQEASDENRTSVVLRENWRYGRWMLGSTILYTLATQIQTFFAAGFLGLDAAGVLRAAAIPMFAMMQGITAMATLALPALSADFARSELGSLRRKGFLLTIALMAFATGCELVLIAFSGPTEKLLYHGRFSGQAWLIPVLGLVALCTAASGHSVVLRAIQRPESNLIVGLVTVPAGIASAYWFTSWWGVAGAAFSMVLAAAAGPVVYITLYRKWFPRGSAATIAPGDLLSPVRPHAAS